MSTAPGLQRAWLALQENELIKKDLTHEQLLRRQSAKTTSEIETQNVQLATVRPCCLVDCSCRATAL